MHRETPEEIFFWVLSTGKPGSPGLRCRTGALHTSLGDVALASLRTGICPRSKLLRFASVPDHSASLYLANFCTL